MADKNIQMTQRNSANTGWDNLNPITTASNVLTADGKTLDATLLEKAKESDTTRLTENKTVTGAINELFTSANDGKNLVANAVTNKGVVASASDTFSLLATKIGEISTGKKFAQSPSIIILPRYKSSFTVNNLDFEPSLVIMNIWNVSKDTGRTINGSDKYYYYLSPTIRLRYSPDSVSVGKMSIQVRQGGFTTEVDPSPSSDDDTYFTWKAYE